MWIQSLYATITSDGITPIESPSEAIDSAIKLAEALDKYGPFLTCIGILCVIFVFVIITTIIVFLYDKICNSKKGERIFGFSEQIVQNAMQKFFQKNSSENPDQQVVSINDEKTRSLVDQCVKKLDIITTNLEAFKPMQKPEVNKDRLKNYWKARDEFNNASKTCLSILECTRVSIYVFHNGNKSLYGFPFFKITCIYDLTSASTKSFASKNHVNCPLNIYGFVGDLYTEGTYVNYNIEETRKANKEKNIDDKGILTFLEFSNTESVYMKAITTDDDKEALCGFAAVEFNNPHKPDDTINNNYIMKTMDNYIKTIKPIICNYDDFDKN